MEYKDIALGEVLEFWFKELSSEDRFSGAPEIDKQISERFSTLHTAVAAGEYWQERSTALSYLAEVIVLDQFSRQLFRGSGKAFAYDGQALCLAQEAIKKDFDMELVAEERIFLYMPFMHSESKVIHEAGLPLFESLNMEAVLKYEKIHKDIIDRFGRYPYRNEQLGRESTKEEIDYLRENQEDFFTTKK